MTKRKGVKALKAKKEEKDTDVMSKDKALTTDAKPVLTSEEDRELRKNQSGCPDPTAYEAIKKVLTEDGEEITDEDARVKRFIKSILILMDTAGFTLLNRMELQDRRTGKIYK